MRALDKILKKCSMMRVCLFVCGATSRSFLLVLFGPELVVLLDDLQRVFSVLGLSIEGEFVGGLSVRDFVISEPVMHLFDVTRTQLSQILNVVELLGFRIFDVDGDHFPIGLSLVDESEAAEGLDLADGASVDDGRSDLNHIQRIFVAEAFRLRILHRGILPRLREGTIVPGIALVVLDVSDETELSVLDVLFDRIVFLGDCDLELSVRAAWNLAHKVEDVFLLVGQQRDVMPRRDLVAVLLKEESVFERSVLSGGGGGDSRCGHFSGRSE